MQLLIGDLQAGYDWKQYDYAWLLKYSKYSLSYLLETKFDKIMLIQGADNETSLCIGTANVNWAKLQFLNIYIRKWNATINTSRKQYGMRGQIDMKNRILGYFEQPNLSSLSNDCRSHLWEILKEWGKIINTSKPAKNKACLNKRL